MYVDSYERYMRVALDLARAVRGQTSPNPTVGAVIVKQGRIVGTGVHLQAGAPHAEVQALAMAGAEALGATLYVTLEPCSHFGRTPPCTKAIISAGIRRVVIGCLDENPLVNGSGAEVLREAGIQVITGVLEKECFQLNELFFHYIRTKMPFVTVKTASTLDGKVATRTGDSKWVTGSEARMYVHRLRHEHDAVMVGIQTVLADDPQLTTRLPEGGKHPVRLVMDSRLRIPLDCKICDTREAPTWVFCTHLCDPEKEKALISKGVRVFKAGLGPRVDLAEAFRLMGGEGITSVLVEGGSTLNGTLLKEGWVNKVIAFIAPKLLGGAGSLSSYGGEGWDRMSDAVSLTDTVVRQFGSDWCVIGYPEAGGNKCVYRHY